MADETAPLMDSGQGSREHGDGGPDDTAPSRWHGFRSRSQVYLASKQKHYFILGLVSLDVMAILTDILVSLITCDTGGEDEPWVSQLQFATKICGLVFSSLFLLELLFSVWAFGFSFFNSWFHWFDAFVIAVSFAVDVLAHGIVEEIGSLVIVLRLWRFVKIVEEMSVGASERMEDLEAKLEQVEQEKAELLKKLESRGGGDANASES